MATEQRLPIGVVVVGYGYWGPELARNVMATPELRLDAVVDERSERRREAWQRQAGLTPYACLVDVLHEVDAVVIATPTSTHADLAEQALLAGKNVLVAKPLAQSSADARRLHDTARDRGLALLVDHTFVYTGAVQRMKRELASLGKLHYYDSVRVNLGIYQPDCDVIWDLAPHDLSILLYLLEESPTHVQVVASDHLDTGRADAAHVTLRFASGLIAHLHLNWLSPVKVRTTLIGGSQKMLVYDDMEPSEKVKIYDSQASVVIDTESDRHRKLVDYRLGDCYVPHLDRREALAVEMEHFRDCILGEAEPISGAEMGIEVVRILEAIDRAAQTEGRVMV